MVHYHGNEALRETYGHPTYILCQSARIFEKPCKILVSGTFWDLLRQRHKTGRRRGGCLLKSVQKPRYLKHDLGTLEPQPCLLWQRNNNNGRAAIHSDTQSCCRECHPQLPSLKRPSLLMRNTQGGGGTWHVVLRVLQRHVYSPPEEGRTKQREVKVVKDKVRLADLCSLTCRRYMMRRTYESHGSAAGFPSVINTWWHWQGAPHT